jgi:hypothetical protein
MATNRPVCQDGAMGLGSGKSTRAETITPNGNVTTFAGLAVRIAAANDNFRQVKSIQRALPAVESSCIVGGIV